MSKTELYSPRAGTLPAQVLDYLRQHPEHTLNTQQIADNFSVSRNSIHTNLAMCIEHNLLTRYKDDDAELTYKLVGRNQAAGNAFNWARAVAKNTPPSPPVEPSPAKTTARAPRAPASDLEGQSIVFDDGIVLPPVKGRYYSGSLIAKILQMQVGQSFQRPYAQKASFVKFVSKCHKSSKHKYTMRTDKAAGNFRIWRIA